MSNREKAMKVCIEGLKSMFPNTDIPETVAKNLALLNDEQFDAYMAKLEDGSEVLSVAVPNLCETKVSMDALFATAKSWDYDPFQQIWLTDAKTGTTYLTPEKYLVVYMPIRRQQQTLTGKISIPDHNRSFDDMSGQVTGDSKGASLSLPEIQILRSQGLDRPILELIKVRGGDHEAMRAAHRQIIETGDAGLDGLLSVGTRAKSTETLSAWMTAQHIANNL